MCRGRGRIWPCSRWAGYFALTAAISLCLASRAFAQGIYALGYDARTNTGRASLIEVHLHPGSGHVLWPRGYEDNALAQTMTRAVDWLILHGCPELSDKEIYFQLGRQSLGGQDGASAGLALVCALYARCKGTALPHDVAVTGAVAADGDVVPVGEIRAKLAAAREAGIRTVLLPLGNRQDSELASRDRVPPKLVYVANVREALEALGAPPQPAYSALPVSSGGGGGSGDEWVGLALVGAANAVLAAALLLVVFRRRRPHVRARATTTLLGTSRLRRRRRR